MSIPLTERPRLDRAAAVSAAAALFGLEGAAVELASERDQNFRITGTTGTWVLKVSNAAQDEALLDLEREFLLRLRTRITDYDFPCPVAASNGAFIRHLDHDGRRHAVRAFEWVDGIRLADVRPRSTGLMRELGTLAGAIGSALEGFEHPAADRDLKWDLRRADEAIARRLAGVADADRRRLLERRAAASWARLGDVANSLPSGIIHNDANDHNVLCAASAPDDDQQHIVGLIDFGDSIAGWRAADTAIAAAYAMLGKADPAAIAATIVGASHARHPLTEDEIAAVFDLAVLRLCLSVAISAEQRAGEPDNEYLSVSEADAWEALALIDTLDPDLVHYRIRAACDLEPCPAGGRLRDWLAERRGTFAPVVETPLEPETCHVFDLGVGSTEVGGGALGVFDTARLSERLFGIMRDAGKAVGIGRYGETRCLYGGELFAAPADEAPRRRTLHVGVDLFLPPEAAVFAPLDGVVVGSQVNEGRLDYGPTILLQHDPQPGLRFWTLYGHLTMESLSESPVGRTVAAGERLGAIGDFPINGDWPPHLHLQVVANLLGREGEFPGVAAPDEGATWRSLSPDPNLILDLDDSLLADDSWNADSILASRHHHLGPSLSISYQRPLHIVRGFRQFLYDVDGQPFLDAVNNVPHVGHSHPAVVRAANLQNEVLNTNTRYLHETLARYAERLVATLPDPLEVCFLVCSGSEANELAIRMARARTGRRDVVVLDAAYHGNTSTLVDISPYKHAGLGGSGAPDWVHVAAMPDPYRGLHRDAGAAMAERYADEVERACAAASDHGGAAAFIAEPLLGCGGQIVPPEGYLADAFARVSAHGGVTIADEVQIGLGRVGTHMWAFEAQEATPDIVTIGKPIGNGYPLGAVVTTREIADAFANGMEYFNTFGGNPVACSVGSAVLDVIEREDLQDNARSVGMRLLEGLRGLVDRHPIAGDARGAGLYLGLELVRDGETLEPAAREASYVVNRVRDHGILVSTDGPDHNVVKIKPPICFQRADADRLVEVLGRVLRETFIVDLGLRA